MKIARERYNPYVPLIEDAQTDIREIVKRAFLYREPKQKTESRLKKAIRTATDGIAIPRLKRDVTVSLINFANRQRVTWQSVGLTPEAVLFLASQKDLVKPRLSRIEAIREELFSAGGDGGDGHIRTYNDSEARGVPLNRYYGDVWRERVQPAIKEAASSNALDPNDYSGRNSLRNLSEMEVRYHDHLDNIDELKASGVRLVVCSSHADCSDRCAPWQGRIYSLDGTSGVVDGHRYVPLETATDVWYTTKAGRRYKNGLLGFNCRHYLKPYAGQLLPTVSAKEREAEYAVTLNQRRLERAVRDAKVDALTNKGLDEKAYKAAKMRAKEANGKYLEYCKANGRAAYPTRVTII